MKGPSSNCVLRIIVLQQILLLVFIFSFTGCLHKVKTVPRSAETSILKSQQSIVIAPFSNDYYGFQDTLYKSLQTNTNYHVKKQDSKDTEVKKELLQNNSQRIQGSISIPKIESRQYFKDQTTCHAQYCWRQKVLCIERNISMEISFLIYKNKSDSVIYKTKIKENDLRTHCADALSPISSINKTHMQLTKKIAATFRQNVTSDIK